MNRHDAPPSRFVRYVISRGWLHLILLCGTGIFLFPFAWMVGTSMKTDDEVTSGDWMPSVPRFIGKSPYVLPPPALVKPLQVDADVWERVSPKLLDATKSSIEPHLAAGTIDSAEHRDAAAAVVVNKLVGRLSTDAWGGNEASLIATYRTMLTDEVISDALADRLARFELRGMLFRALDSRVFNIGKSGAGWQVESGPGKLVTDSSSATFLQYDFADSSAPPVVLRRDFDFPVDPKDWHKLICSIKADATWHRIDATLDVAGEHWVGQRPTYLFQNRPVSILFQPPTFEEDTFKKKIWTLMKPVSKVESRDSRKAIFRLTLSPSSTLLAIGAKVRNNYRRVFEAVPFWKYVGNSLVLVILCTVGTLFSSTFVAYAFARLRWPGRSVAFLLLLSTMMLPGQVTMIPSFMIWRTVGWYNTLNPMWVPAFLGSAFFIFLMVQHMKTIPRDLEEAARIDGLNAVQIWWYIIVPLVKPAAAAIAIMTAMGAWNEFMGPLIYLRDQGRFPLSLGIFALRSDYGDSGIDWPLIMSCNVLMIMPVVLLFLVFQRYFVQGMTMSGMKG